jgi:hypothetical protein
MCRCELRHERCIYSHVPKPCTDVNTCVRAVCHSGCFCKSPYKC